MYYRNGWNIKKFLGELSEYEDAALSQVISEVKELAADVKVFENYLKDVATPAKNGRYYYFSENCIIEFETGFCDFPVRIYVYRNETKFRNEYMVVYRDGDIYKTIDNIFSEDSAYEVMAMIIKAGYEDCRIEKRGN